MTQPADSDPAADEGAQDTLSYGDRVRDGYYVYGLVDPTALRDTDGDMLLSIFYVGKGRGARWATHEKDVHAALVREQELLVERRASKAERIRKILDRGHHVPAVRMSAGYVDEKDAYYAESLAIDTIGALLDAAGRPPLTNATPGHKAGFVWLREHFIYTQTTEQDLAYEPPSAADLTGVSDTTTGRREILVKGTRKDLVEPGQRLTGFGSLPVALATLVDRVRTIELLGDDHPDARTRRGWDPLDPWTDHEARDRARRYWPIAADRVAGWLRDPTTMPEHLLLGIEEPGGRTVVRYAWTIDRDAPWEYYPQRRRWGIPLDTRVRDHPRLGAALYETRNGRRVQVLANYAAGIRVLDA